MSVSFEQLAKTFDGMETEADRQMTIPLYLNSVIMPVTVW
jgi:hypothetical protein